MQPERALREQLARILDWDHAHIRFDDAVKDFPRELRGRRPAGGPHSAWELLEHLRIALWDILEFTRDAKKHVSPKFPDGYWPATEAPPADEAWDASVAAYREHLRAFAALIADESVDLYRAIPHSEGQTPLREVLLAADHNAYHLGQLMMVRRLLEHSAFQPAPLADVYARSEGNRWTLVFARELHHSPESLWRVLTDPAMLAQWAPFDADRDLGATGKATLTMAGGGGETLRADVRRAEAPASLEYTWGEDLLHWELEAVPAGTRLTLRHTVADETWVPKMAAGWHICLDVADRLLSGSPVGRIVGHEARQHGWEQLNDAYATRLGIENTGWPL